MIVVRNTNTGKFTKAPKFEVELNSSFKVEAAPLMSAERLREEWLMKLARLMQPELERRFVAHKLPAFRVTCGFPSKGGELGKKSRTRGECWSASASADSHCEIFISPVEADAPTVAAILAHELGHAACGHKAGHGPVFQRAMKSIGHVAPFTSSAPTPDFMEWVAPLLAQVGAYPHARLNAMAAIGAPKKQGTRLLKLECPCCGYTVRTTAKWLAVGVPSCPSGTEMLEAGAEAGAEAETEH